ncbi:OmpP1/FadL family transporter [Isoalcanivorax beigongshangi]|uniref:OmpP1/FadL family transporter n=1 Tax=Isoalcanivorax beigongshangi TaxID=3238810 RepID=A0ABV4AJ97_9GAMM
MPVPLPFRLRPAVRRPGQWWPLLACALPLAMTSAHANMGNTATTYGLLPADVGTAQGLSLFNSQVSATYYNPAYLAADPRGELTAGFLHADHELRVNSLGGAQAPIRDGKVLDDTPSQQVLIGMKTNIGSLTKYDMPMYLGFMAGIEKYGQEMMAFNSQTSSGGQFFNYGRQPLFLAIGGAANLWRGVDVGASLRVTLHANASMRTNSTLAGDTSHENLDVSAKPVMRPIVGMNVRWGETFCTSTPCWADAFETALVYKGYSNTRTKVDATAIIDQVIAAPGLNLALQTLDSFQPEIISAGMLYKMGPARLALSAEFQRWSRLGRELERDTLKDQANLSFDDIVIPRIGLDFKVLDELTLMTGVAWEKSPLKGRESLDVNYFDNDRVVLGIGASLEVKNPPVFAFPMRLDVGYQYHMLKKREFDLSRSDSQINPVETISAEGDVHVFTGSVTLKF